MHSKYCSLIASAEKKLAIAPHDLRVFVEFPQKQARSTSRLEQKQ